VAIVTRQRLAALGAFLSLCAAALPTLAAGATLEVAPVTRLPFPERGYVVSSPDGAALDPSSLQVRENGGLVRDVRITPVAASGLRFGAILAVDASKSMAGPPFTAAMNAARTFVNERQEGAELGFVAFNGDVTVVQAPTSNAEALTEAFRNPPDLAYGTRIYDALDRSIELLRDSRISAGTVVLLSDGADVGSSQGLDHVVAAAEQARIRIFTIGLRSDAYDGSALEEIARRTGGTYAEASSAAELDAIYAELGHRLASEYLVQYRSDARPESRVVVDVNLAGAGNARADYVAPTPARIDPYHRSLVSRFVLAPASIAVVGLAFAALLGWALLLLTRGPKRNIVERIGHFSATVPTNLVEHQRALIRKAMTENRYTQGWWGQLERDLEIARLDWSARKVAFTTAASSLALLVVMMPFSPALALVGLIGPPIAAQTIVRWKLRSLRNEFDDQLPTALQVLASSLRAGHSFSAALDNVVQNTTEPARSELRRIVQDDQLGVPPEIAIRKTADRMANRDLEQVALLAELQRTAGGNSAEVLDTVVETIRQRGELRRLVRALTAQGRMARWILTGLPIGLTGFLWALHPDLMGAFFSTGIGQAALLIALAMVAAGSLVIQKIVDIDV
jgi:tight adherence protein B